jgi:hypothetical protein
MKSENSIVPIAENSFENGSNRPASNDPKRRMACCYYSFWQNNGLLRNRCGQIFEKLSTKTFSKIPKKAPVRIQTYDLSSGILIVIGMLCKNNVLCISTKRLI